MNQHGKPSARQASAEPAGRRIPARLHRNVSVIKASEPHVIEELLARRRLGPLVAGRLGPLALLVEPGREAAVIEELRRSGQTPRVIRGRGHLR